MAIFSRAQADALLAELHPRLERARELAGRLASNRREPLRAGGNGHRAILDRLATERAELQAIVDQVTSLGVVYRDPQTGLIDFPAERDGRPVYLCWRLGEASIAWWHDRDAGIAGRTPLD